MGVWKAALQGQKMDFYCAAGAGGQEVKKLVALLHLDQLVRESATPGSPRLGECQT